MPAGNDTAFEAVARAYELLVNEETRWERERDFHVQLIQESIGPTRSMREAAVLDLGCGTGFHARHLAGSHGVARVVGVDPSASMLQVAAGKEHGDRVTWLKGAAETPPLPREIDRYDTVMLMGNTFSLIKYVHPVLDALAAVTRPAGGRFVIQMIDYDRLRGLGPQVTERSSSECRIIKHLKPIAGADSGQPGIRVGAELSIEVQSVSDGRTLDRQQNVLYEHPEAEWAESADKAGWSIIQRRAGYGPDPTVGIDRIFILQRKA
ncbi:MAG: methyltransferase domain-containing protein [Planctomycetes bacterium]|nr:methyltransferase domain-containing protein [Planctomycetota bacterium]